MKKLGLFIFILFSHAAYSQSYPSIIAEADELYNKKEYQKSVEKFKTAFKLESRSASDFYNAACSAALSGNNKLALEWLNLAYQNGWTNINHLKSDSDLNSLHDSKEWEKLVEAIQKASDKVEANYDKPLQAKLLAIYTDDQAVRHQYLDARKNFGPESRQADSLAKIMMFKDSINQILVTEILDQYGWVGPDKVGGQANQTLFLVIQHADLTTQQKYLPMMREAVKNKKANSSALALLEDRVALGEGRKQTYGSQIGWDKETNTYFVLPLEDPDHVDERRSSVGLGTLADYVKGWSIQWNVEEYKRDLPKIEAWHKSHR